MEYQLVRSRRKTIGLYITKQGTLEVRAPQMATVQQIERFVDSNQAWIDRHLLSALQRREQKEAFAIKIGDNIQLQGKEYPLVGVDTIGNRRAGFDGNCFFLPNDFDSAQIKQTIVLIYKQLASDILQETVAYYATVMQLQPKQVKINSAKTRWGSCSAKGVLNFSWRLVMADNSIIHYVVVHELAHLIQLNHSALFWNEVKAVLPEYKQCEKGLKDLQRKLLCENWE